MTDKKICSNCSHEKDIEQFSIYRRSNDGLKSQCKACCSISGTKYYTANKTSILEKYKERTKFNLFLKAKRRINVFEKDFSTKVFDDGTVTEEFINCLLKNPFCSYCNVKLELQKVRLEHKIPLIKNGKHTADNVTLSCDSCNASKGILTPDEFYNSKYGLVKTKRCAVVARNIKDYTEYIFNNTNACSKEFDIDQSVLFRHLTSDRAGKLTKKWCVFKFLDETEWPFLSEEEKFENTFQYGTGICISKKVLFGRDNLDNIPLGHILITKNRSEACRFLNFNEKSLRTNIVNSKDKLYRGWYFNLDNSPIKNLLENMNKLTEENFLC